MPREGDHDEVVGARLQKAIRVRDAGERARLDGSARQPVDDGAQVRLGRRALGPLGEQEDRHDLVVGAGPFEPLGQERADALRVVGRVPQVELRVVVGVDADADDVGAPLHRQRRALDRVCRAARLALHPVDVERVGRELDLLRPGRQLDVLERERRLAVRVEPDLAAVGRRVADELSVAKEPHVVDAGLDRHRSTGTHALAGRLRDLDGDGHGAVRPLRERGDRDGRLHRVEICHRPHRGEPLARDDALEEARLEVLAHEDFDRQRRERRVGADPVQPLDAVERVRVEAPLGIDRDPVAVRHGHEPAELSPVRGVAEPDDRIGGLGDREPSVGREGHLAHRVGVAGEAEQLAPGRRVPYARRRVAAAHEDALPVGREGDRVDVDPVAGELAKAVPPKVPELRNVSELTGACGQDALPVGREGGRRQVVEARPVADRQLDDLGPRRGVPDRPVEEGEPVVGGEGDGRIDARLSGQAGELSSGRQVPDSRGEVAAVDGQEAARRRERHRVWRLARRSRERADDPPRRGVGHGDVGVHVVGDPAAVRREGDDPRRGLARVDLDARAARDVAQPHARAAGARGEEAVGGELRRLSRAREPPEGADLGERLEVPERGPVVGPEDGEPSVGRDGERAIALRRLAPDLSARGVSEDEAVAALFAQDLERQPPVGGRRGRRLPPLGVERRA